MIDPDIPVLINAARARARVLRERREKGEHGRGDAELLDSLAERLERLAREVVAAVASPYWTAFLERGRRG